MSRVGGGTVGDEDDVHRQALVALAGNDAAAGEGLVVLVRGDDHGRRGSQFIAPAAEVQQPAAKSDRDPPEKLFGPLALDGCNGHGRSA